MSYPWLLENFKFGNAKMLGWFKDGQLRSLQVEHDWLPAYVLSERIESKLRDGWEKHKNSSFDFIMLKKAPGLELNIKMTEYSSANGIGRLDPKVKFRESYAADSWSASDQCK